MAGPVPTYLATQLAAQTAFTVPFGLLTLVNTAINTATAAGQFNTTVDCSLFTMPDIANLGNYLHSLGYSVDATRGLNGKTIGIDWGLLSTDQLTAGTVTVSNFPTIQPVSGTIAATQSGPWTVSLTSGSVEIGTVDQGHAGIESWLVDVTNVVPVTGTFFQAVQPVSGTVTANQGTSPWITSVSNFPATVAVTQSTSPWAISGTVTANAGTGTFLVDGSAHTQPISGTIAATQSGAWTTGRTWTLLNTTDSVNVGNFPVLQAVAIDQTGDNNDVDIINGSGAAAVNIQDGGNSITVDGTVTITPSGTQNVAIVSNVTDFATQTTLAEVEEDLDQFTFTATRLLVDGSGVTQPVSGVVAVTQSTSPWVISGTVTTTPSGIQTVAIDQTGDNNDVDVINGAGAAAVNVQDGGNSITVDGTVAVSNFPATQNVSVVTALPTGANVIGHIIADSGSTIAVTGNVTVIQPTGTNLHTVVDSGTITLSGTSPVSGTVTSNQGTANTPANKWPVEIVDSGGVNIATIDATGDLQVDVNNFPASQIVTGTVAATQSGEWDVNIEDSAGNALTSTASALDVNIKSTGVTQPVSGTVTVDFVAGTLNNGAETAVTGSAVQVLAANANREKLIVQNTGVANVRVGTTGVTTTTGFRLTVGATVIFDEPNCPTNAIFAIREGTVSSTVLAQEIT